MIDVTNQMTYRLGNLNAENTRLSYQMSTGKKLDRGSDDTGIYARELYINDKIRIYDGLKVQVDKTQAQNNVSDSTIGEVKLSLDSIKTEILKSLNAGMDASDKIAVAVNINGIRENILTLSNERTNGEYLFTGSNTTIQPFVEDEATGKIFYNGDAQLRSIAVAPNTYRERGVTGLDVFMYTSHEASTDGVDNQLTFSAGELIVDEEGLQWHNTKALQNDRLTFSVDDAILDDAGAAWTLNADKTALVNGVNSIEVEHVKGDQYRTVSIHDDHITGGGTAPTYLQVDSGKDGIEDANAQIRQFDINGNIVMVDDGAGGLKENAINLTTIPASGVDPERYETDPLTTKNQVLTAKHSFFDDITKIVTALETDTNDDTGTITGLRSTLDMVSSAFDAANIGHSVLGARNKIFELAQDSISSRLTHYNILYQEVAGADLSKVAMESKSLEMTYTALYSTISKMNDMSLINFIR